jgi:hypothetical protein
VFALAIERQCSPGRWVLDRTGKSIPAPDSFIPERGSNGAKAWIVDRKYLNGRSTYLGSPNQVGTAPFKMIAPRVPSGIEERNNFASFRVPSCNVGALAPVAVDARQRQIGQAGFTGVLARYDVVDVEGRCVGRLGHVAIFAAPLCPIPNGADQALIHILASLGRSALRRATRARECMTDKTFAILT